MELNETTLLPFIGTIVGTIGLEFIKRWLSRNKDREDNNTKMREELRAEVYKLREELRVADAELDKWRNQYFDLKEQFLQVKMNLEVALRMLKDENDDQTSTDYHDGE